VCHHYVALFDPELQNLAEPQPKLAPVNVAAYGAYWAMFFEAVYYNSAAYVACMPNLVTIIEMRQVPVVPPAMGVRHQAYTFHSAKRCFM
jgi:hypothetical protein